MPGEKSKGYYLLNVFVQNQGTTEKSQGMSNNQIFGTALFIWSPLSFHRKKMHFHAPKFAFSSLRSISLVGRPILFIFLLEGQ